MPQTAKVFMNGRSQAVRLPQEFRFDCDEVYIEKQGDAVILRPKPTDMGKWLENFYRRTEPMPDFLAEREDLPPRDREWFHGDENA